MTTIPEILLAHASAWPDREALVETRRGKNRVVSYRRLAEASDRFAAKLQVHEVKPGDAVLVFVPMSVGLYVALLGIFRLGATAVFLDPTSGITHMNSCCARLPPAAVVAGWGLRFFRPFVAGLRRIPRALAPPEINGTPTSMNLPAMPAADDPALITFTSGSTGVPKAAVRSHRFLIAQHKALQGAIALQEGERDLTTLPVFVLANLASGVTSILPDAKISHPGSVNPQRLRRQCRDLRPDRTGGSPAFYQRMMMAGDGLQGFRKIFVGGAPVFPVVLRAMQDAAPEAEVVAVYGSTEAEPIAHVACREITESDWTAMRAGKGLLAGRPVGEVQVRVIRDQWGNPVQELAPLPAGEIGEIVVTGGHVLQGYLGGVGDEETKVRDNDVIWHRTGDAGYLDGQGRIWLMGRCAARVQDAGGTIYPFAVECVAMTFAGIRRAALVASGSRRLLVLEGMASRDSPVVEQIRAALAWADLADIHVVNRIPVDARHNAKVNYPKLLRLLKGKRRDLH